MKTLCWVNVKRLKLGYHDMQTNWFLKVVMKFDFDTRGAAVETPVKSNAPYNRHAMKTWRH